MKTGREMVLGRIWRRVQRVLIVDDDPTYRESLNALFTDWQWDVFEASSGREAADILDRHAINLVLLDAASQGAGGAHFVAALRPQTHERTIIVMSAVMTKTLRNAWRSRGAMECLRKPISPETLSALLVVCAPPSGFGDS